MNTRLPLNSEQESLIEELMEKSFGAQFLYTDNHYTKRGIKKEAGDLVWCSGGVATIFNLTAGNKSLEKQQEHNVHQFEKYLKQWKTGAEQYTLRGKNRFGDTCYLKHRNLDYIVFVSLVSHDCPISLIKPIDTSLNEIWINAPDSLLGFLSNFGATIIDFIKIIGLATDGTGDCRNLPLEKLAYHYHMDSVSSAPGYSAIFTNNAQYDFYKMQQVLTELKLPHAQGKYINSGDARKELAEVFCDMTTQDYAVLTSAAMRAIKESEPPLGKKWAIVSTQGLHYRFVIATINLASSNVVEVTNHALNAMKSRHENEPEAFGLFYHFMWGGTTIGPGEIIYPAKMPLKSQVFLACKKIFDICEVGGFANLPRAITK